MKNPRALWLSIAFVAALVVGAIAGFATGTRPVLGLDLEGGVSVILSAPPGTPKDVMDQALENIRNRIDAFGVAEPQLFVNGTNIDVELPGLAQGGVQPRAKQQWCLIGSGNQSLGCFPTQADAAGALSAGTVKSQITQVCLTGLGANAPCFGTQAAADAAVKAIAVQPLAATSAPSPSASPPPASRYCLTGTGLPTTPCYATKKVADAARNSVGTQPTETFCLVGQGGAPLQGDQGSACFDSQDQAKAALSAISVKHETREFCVVASTGKSQGCYISSDVAQAHLQATGQERLLEIIGTTARLEQRQVLSTITPGSPSYTTTPVTCPTNVHPQPPNCSFGALRNRPVTFLGQDGTTKYNLGPVLITGDAIKKAAAVYRTATSTNLQTGWEIDFQLTPAGSKTFSDVTTRLTNKQLAIVVDQQVISAPTVQSPITGGNGVITGSFAETRAKDLATQLNAGALPVQLTKQQVVTVSPTLGRESLHQGLVAGIVGLVALALYLAFYYRLLGIVTWLGMSIWAVLAFGLVSLLGRTAGYSLTLAGVAGLIVSLGITADSYIVFFERLKDEVRHGKTPRSAIAPAFKRAFKTIVTADFVTFLAAGILYLVAVSSVRGFALTLGLSTILDVFVVYFFKRPTVFLIARSARLQNLRGFGLASGVAAEPVPVAGASE